MIITRIQNNVMTTDLETLSDLAQHFRGPINCTHDDLFQREIISVPAFETVFRIFSADPLTSRKKSRKEIMSNTFIGALNIKITKQKIWTELNSCSKRRVVILF